MEYFINKTSDYHVGYNSLYEGEEFDGKWLPIRFHILPYDNSDHIYLRIRTLRKWPGHVLGLR